MEAARAAYAAFRAQLAALKAKKMKAFESRYRHEHPAVNGSSDAAKGAVIRALQAHAQKLDANINKRLAQAKVKLFAAFKETEAATAAAAAAARPKFVPAPAFDGSRPGYAFRRGEQGLGYYSEDTAAAAAAAAGPLQPREDAEELGQDAATPEPARVGVAFPYDPYATLHKADMQYHRAMKGRNRRQAQQEHLAPALSAGERRGPAGVPDAATAAAFTNDWDGAAAGAAVAWADLFEDPALPLVLDVGCGQAKFVLRFALHEAEVAAEAAKTLAAASRAADAAEAAAATGGGGGDDDDGQDTEAVLFAALKQRKAARAARVAAAAADARRHNFLGIEMRLGLVEQATQTRAALDHAVGPEGRLRAHAAFLHATVNTAFLEAALRAYPGPVALLCVQLPDPRLKKNMKRRGTKKLTLERIVQPALAAAVAERMRSEEGLVYLSSEYRPLALEMRRFFLRSGRFAMAPTERVRRCRFLSAADGESLGAAGGDLRAAGDSDDAGEPVGEAAAAAAASAAIAAAADSVAATGEPEFWDGQEDEAGEAAAADGGFDGAAAAEEGATWLEGNPFGCPTAREMFLYKTGRRVYRDLLVCAHGTHKATTSGAAAAATAAEQLPAAAMEGLEDPDL